VQSKSLRITTTTTTTTIIMKIDYRITLNCIYNDWLSPNNNNEMNIP
jgi:hypothetical protein